MSYWHLKERRPVWIDEFLENDVSWQLFDPERNRLKMCRCSNQKEAIKKALSYGIVPSSTQHVVPMKGNYRTEIMDEKEFQKFMELIRS